MADLKKLKELTRTSTTCKKHPKHKQSPGVCSVCLTERLSKLANGTRKSSNTTMADSFSSSSLSSVSSYYSSSASASASASSSPLHGFRRLTTTTLFRGKTKLTKSISSMAYFPRFRVKEAGDEQKSKGGIWSKFMERSRRKLMRETLKHNQTDH